jgi:ABC-type transport system substrate-binding protein
MELINDLAAEAAVSTGSAEPQGWTIDVNLRDDIRWSDGEAITAHDIAFTYATVRDLELGGEWLSAYPQADPDNADVTGLTDVQAVSASTVRFIFNRRPQLPIWPHGVGLAPIMPAHVWADSVVAAKNSEDPAAELYAVVATDFDVSSGPMILEEQREGAFARTIANESYHDLGREITSGNVDYRVGPFTDEAIFVTYDSEDAAVRALEDGDVDLLLNPLGMHRRHLAQVQNDSDLAAIINPTYSFRYLAFNLRKEPMSIHGFRNALALMIDKEFMANNIFQGAILPQYSTMSEANLKWHNAEVAESFALQYRGKSISERLTGAVQMLKDEGFTWEIEPSIPVDDQGNELNAVSYGVGIMYKGTRVPPLEILAPGPGYEPLRATYSLWIETWLNQLGFEAEAHPTDLREIVGAVTPNLDNIVEFDMVILGWDLGDNPSFPNYHEAIFYGPNDVLINGGSNWGGYHSDEFDALVEEFRAAQSEEFAFDILWQMEEVLFRDNPYIVLFDNGILEFYRSADVEYPFTRTLNGFQYQEGMPSLVTATN